MQQNHAIAAPPSDSSPDSRTMVLFEAIARHRQIGVTYNGMSLQLAPHVLYTRGDMLYLAAFATKRRGEPVRVAKLSIFKVEGLSDMTLLADPFAIDPAFDRADPRYAATTVFVVEP